MGSMTVSEARAALPELLTRVGSGEEIVITRHGVPAAVLVRPDTLRSRAVGALEAADRVRELLAEGSSAPLTPAAEMTAERADELIADLRAGREAR